MFRCLFVVLIVPSIVFGEIKFGTLPKPVEVASVPKSEAVEAGAAPTPYREVVRVVGLLPKPEVGFVDFGCGDARWLIVAAERWGCRATGIEIDPKRAQLARQRVREAGLDHLITIVDGDAPTVDVKADVGVAYLYPDVLEQLKPKVERLRAFASYIHRPAGLPVVKNGDSWIYTKPTVARSAVWNGQAYAGPVCSNPNCGMCQSIRAQLSGPEAPAATKSGHWVKRCNGRQCWFEWVP
jgi:SAM-dependent methyltransferase